MPVYLLLVLSGALLLSACADLPLVKQQETASTEDWRAKQVRLLALQDWDLTGRMGLKLAGIYGRGFSATLKWTQQQQDYRVLLIAPFGRGTAMLYTNDNGVTLHTHDNQQLSAASPEELLQHHFGWTLPVKGLAYWIRGIPQPGIPVHELLLDGQQRLKRLQQSGWQIRYGQYGQAGQYELPTRLHLDHDEISVRLAVTQWLLE